MHNLLQGSLGPLFALTASRWRSVSAQQPRAPKAPGLGSEDQSENQCCPHRQNANIKPSILCILRKKPFYLVSLQSLWRCVWKPFLPLNSSLWPFIHLQIASPESQLNYLLSPLCPDTLVECMKNKAARSDGLLCSHEGLSFLFSRTKWNEWSCRPNIYMC